MKGTEKSSKCDRSHKLVFQTLSQVILKTSHLLITLIYSHEDQKARNYNGGVTSITTTSQRLKADNEFALDCDTVLSCTHVQWGKTHRQQ